MSAETRRDSWVDLARIAAAYAVIVLHAASTLVVETPVGSPEWWLGNIFDSMSRWSVPVFVMLSGYLLLGQRGDEDFLVFYKKRASRILIPTIFWSVFYLLLRYFFGNHSLTSHSVLNALLSGTPFSHMWFLYMLVGLYVFTPFIRIGLTGFSDGQLSALCAMLFCIAAVSVAYDKLYVNSVEQQFFITLFPLYLPYFIAGHAIQRWPRLNRDILAVITTTAILLTALGTYALARVTPGEMNFYFYTYLSITVIPMSLGFFSLMQQSGSKFLSKTNDRVKQLAGLTFGIYLVHPVFLLIFDRFLTVPAILIPVQALFVFFISAAMSCAIGRMPYGNRLV